VEHSRLPCSVSKLDSVNTWPQGVDMLPLPHIPWERLGGVDLDTNTVMNCRAWGLHY
jgi:hypothetical protein